MPHHASAEPSWYKSDVTSKERLARQRLQWVEHARLGILSAVGDDVVHPQFQVFPTVDPLRFILKITLLLPIGKATREHLRTYLRAWAQEFSCDVPIIDIHDGWIQAEVLTQTRVWSRDARTGKFQGDQRFVRRTR
jgi:hypothetical protein